MSEGHAPAVPQMQDVNKQQHTRKPPGAIGLGGTDGAVHSKGEEVLGSILSLLCLGSGGRAGGWQRGRWI